MIVISGLDSSSFKSAIDEAFSDQLCGRSWQPLVARLCDAENLKGLPMLRQLPDLLVGSDYNAEFLRRNCAINDDNSRILDLYIAMSQGAFSWPELRVIAPKFSGLEASWSYDPILDGPNPPSDHEKVVRKRAKSACHTCKV
jgi:hypothetical protein